MTLATPANVIALDRVWCIIPDYGCEGLREPIGAWLSEEEAQRQLAILDRVPVGMSLIIAEVPLEGALAVQLRSELP